MHESEILKTAFSAFEDGRECRIKMPSAAHIHDFNMALNSLSGQGYITISKRNMTEVCIEITEKGLEKFM